MLNPLVSLSLGVDLDTAEDFVCESRLQGSGELARVRAMDPEGAGVCLFLDVHAPVAVVGEADRAGRAIARRDTYVGGQGVREWLLEELETKCRAIDRMISAEVYWILLAELEGAVADELCVDATIA